ncbi:MAG: hypothetical protein EB149_07090, partial [Thaumarchaeota archaeon]|nr:hypothetical protein [Nitrososphaerota archaeon]
MSKAAVQPNLDVSKPTEKETTQQNTTTQNTTIPKGPSLFIDEPQEGKLFLDFDKYVDAISNIILNSHPQYAIGIFGSWGMGKTTLLLNVNKKLKNDVLCVNFNAWRYENESSHATIPLLMTILLNLYQKIDQQNPTDLDQSSDEDSQNRTKTAKKGTSWRDKIMAVLSGLSIDFKVGIPGLTKLGVTYDVSKVTDALKPKSDEEEDDTQTQSMPAQKTTLHDGLDLIENLLEKVDGPMGNKDLKLVMFIDDLDRCTPEKAVQVFESIKTFLNIKGIVFVLGLSRDIVEAAINHKYKEFEELRQDGLFTGSDYL